MVTFLLTHWGRDRMDAISQTPFLSAFSWMKMYEFRLKFHWSLFLRVQLTIFQHWFRWWLGAGQATSHYLNQWWFIYWCIYASLGLNELNTHNRHSLAGPSRHNLGVYYVSSSLPQSYCMQHYGILNCIIKYSVVNPLSAEKGIFQD